MSTAKYGRSAVIDESEVASVGKIEFSVADDGVATIIFKRPEKLNALDTAMADEIFPRLCQEAQRRDDVRAVIITGRGRAFCTGADAATRLDTVARGDMGRNVLEQPLAAFALAVAHLSKPVIAAVNGIAAGGGLSIALLADFRIASDRARLTTVYVRRGLMPDGGMTSTLPRLVGLAKALDLLMTGDEIDGPEAARIGLVSRVVPHDTLMDEARALARRLASGPPLALSFTKRAVWQSSDHSLEDQMHFESWGQGICLKTDDFREGVQAFLEKRRPQFRGR